MELKQGRDEAAVLQNDVLTTQHNLDAVMQRLAQSSLEGQVQQSNAALLAAASVPYEATSPDLFLNSEVGVFFGLFLGIGAALFAEMMDRSVRASEDLEQLFEGVPVLGRIPVVRPRDMLAAPATVRLLRSES